MILKKSKRKYVMIQFLVVLILGLALWIFVQKTVNQAEGEQNAAVFRVKSMDAVDIGEKFNLSDYYITNKVNIFNRYYIDDDGDLWGYGHNQYGQLGNGNDDDLDTFYSDPVKIASDVVSVDCSDNGYFCIYLTSDGKLYGMGSNMLGLLGKEYSEEISYAIEDYVKVEKPVLLMDDVSYARAGREAIAALKEDGSVWWWGQYRSTYSTQKWSINEEGEQTDRLAWNSTDDENNSQKMLFNTPHKILEDCKYVTTGNAAGAAISNAGELYTWGLNIFGECGTQVTGDDYLRQPQKVLEDVKMVWLEQIIFDSMEDEIPDILGDETTYVFNTFALLDDGTFMAAGRGLGDEEKTIAITGDLEFETTHRYSEAFVPITLDEYSEQGTRKVLEKLEWGMSVDEIEHILNRNGVLYSWLPFHDKYSIEVESSQYFLVLGQDKKLTEIYLQKGGSRNQLFTLGMSRDAIEEKAGCDLTVLNTDANGYDIYMCAEPISAVYYGFVIQNDVLKGVYESETCLE